MIRTAVITATPVVLAIGSPAQADWAGVAVNNETGHYGYALRFNNSSQAGNRALGFCNDFSKGAGVCEVVMTTESCGGIARGYKSFAPQLFVAQASNRDVAGADALAACNDALGATCNLVRSFCADDQ